MWPRSGRVVASAAVLLCAAKRGDTHTTFNSSGCINPDSPTSYPNCNLLASTLSVCKAATPVSAALHCYCQPQVLSAVFNCESEDRLCEGSPNPDGEYQSVAKNWHLSCDSFTSFPFVTPSIATLTTTIDQDVCTSVYYACQSGAYLLSQCYSSYSTLAPGLKSCLCDPQLLTQAYTCEYIGAIYCGGHPVSANISVVQGYGSCSGYSSIFSELGYTGPFSAMTPSGIPAAPASFSGASVTGSSSSPGTSATTQQIIPASSTSAAPATTPTAPASSTSSTSTHTNVASAPSSPAPIGRLLALLSALFFAL